MNTTTTYSLKGKLSFLCLIFCAFLLLANFAALAQTTVTLNSSGSSGSYTTGYTTSSARTDGNLSITNSAQRGWAVFNLSSLNIPTGSTINSVSLIFTITATSGTSGTLACKIYGYAGSLAGSSSSPSASTTYSDCASGTALCTTTWGTAATTKTLTLNATGIAFIQNNFSSSAVSICFAETSTSRTYTITGEGGSSSTQPELSINYTAPCSGTPTAGSAVSSVATACPGTSFNLSLSGATVAPGLTYQWQSSPHSANSWSNITGATTATYAMPSISAATDFQCIVTCTNGNASATSSTVSVSLYGASLPYSEGFESITANNQFPNCMSATDAGSYVLTYTTATGSYNQEPHSGSAFASFEYLAANDYLFTPGFALTGGVTYQFSFWYITDGLGGSAGNGEYNAAMFYGTSATSSAMTNTIGTALTNFNNTTYTQWTGNFTPATSGTYFIGINATNTNGSTDFYWSIDDLALATLPNCSGSPTAGTATATASSACTGYPFNLSLSGYTVAGAIGLQWQSSPSGTNTWSNISGATTATYSTTQSAATDYRCVVTCSASNQTDTSNTVTLTQNSPTNCYCTPSYQDAFSSPYYMSSFSVTGASSTAISDGSYTPSNTYTNRTSAFSAVSFQQGVSYSGSITFDYTYYMFAAIWIDFNDDGFFTSNEMVVPGALYPACGNSTISFSNLAIPITANTGTHRMRVRSVYASSYYCVGPSSPIDPCASSDASAAPYAYGDTRDYLATITAAPACSGSPSAGTATASVSQACPATSFTLSLSGSSISSGLTYQWQSSPSGANTWSNIPGATTFPYTVSSITASTDYRCVVTCTNGNTSANSSAVTVSAFVNNVHYFEGFESMTANQQLPDCMSATHFGTLTYTYDASQGTYGRTAHSGNAFGSYYYPSNDYFFTPAFNLTAGVSYQFSFWYVTDGYSGWETLGGYYGTSATAAAMTTAIGTPLSTITNTTYQQFSGTFTPPTSGTYYLGVYCLGNTVPYYLTIDDIQLTAVPTISGSTGYCAGGTISLTAASVANSPSYSWTGPNGFTANTATISIPNATTAAAGTYSVVVTSDGISASPVTQAVTVSTVPSVNPISNQGVCNGALGSIAISGTVSGTVYSWTNSNTSIGLPASGASNISFTATNTGTAPITGLISITPTVAGCVGTPLTFNLSANPIPTVTAPSPSSQTVCNNASSTSLSFSGSSVSNTAYNWTNNTSSIGLAASGSGTIAPFTTINTGTSAVTATVTISPVANGCAGSTQSYSYIVNPSPNVTAISNQAICNGSSTATVSPGGSLLGGTSYNWTNSNTAIGLGASGSGNIVSFTPVNTGNTPVVSTVTVTPVTSSCSGTPAVFTITDNPIAAMTGPTGQTVCNGLNSVVTSFSSTVSGATFSWTNDNTTVGLAASGTGNIAPFAAINTGTSPVVAHVSVTPSIGGCPGSPQTYTITVNPSPNVNAVGNQTVCNNTSTSLVTFGSSTSGAAFNWTNNNTSINLAASGNGNIGAFNATNTGTSAAIATISVTPVANSCPGTPAIFSITVNPTPVVETPGNLAVCNGGKFGIHKLCQPGRRQHFYVDK